MIYSTAEKSKEILKIMRLSLIRLSLFAVLIINYLPAYTQSDSTRLRTVGYVIDSLKKEGFIFNENRETPSIVLSADEAIRFLRHQSGQQFWKDENDPLRKAFGQLIYEASHPPYDTVELYLKTYAFDSLKVPWDKYYIWEPLRFRIPVSPVPPNELKADTLADSLNAGRLADLKHDFSPGLKDTTILVVLDTLDNVSSDRPDFPFRYTEYPYQADSVKVAVNTLLEYIENRDSSIIYLTGAGNSITPVWLNSRSDKAIRYWLRNEYSDSVTIWVDNPARDTIGLYLENGVNFRRPSRQLSNVYAKINVESIDKSNLSELQKIMIKPRYWKYRSEASFMLNQTALYNWVKGGEKSISFLTDIIGYATYTNPELKITSVNYARIKLGFLKSGENPLRKNVDLIETNFKVNHKAFGKFDFSAIMLFKTQLAPGYNYSADPPPMVSKFLNPSILTMGLGLDYKPSKVTSINFSPFSFKSTLVSDTAHIDQTKYGIPENKRSRNEPGASLVVTNEYKPVKNVTLVNRLQLFTNYINNPLNIDVDWELTGVFNLNWFTEIRLNTHLIYDDDTKTVVLDEENKPVLGPDGLPKKTARVQFKEMFGLSMIFRF
jgi:hypothetical protein